jgi:hypothetical protein
VSFASLTSAGATLVGRVAAHFAIFPSVRQRTDAANFEAPTERNKKTEVESMRCVVLNTLVLSAVLSAAPALAVPSFARQTGQSCVACHAGGQFPELTSYGRMFKLTGYTLGERKNPLAAMVVGSLTRTRNNTDSAGETVTPLDGKAIFDFASVFLAGKVTDNVGAFAQYTFVAHDHQDDTGRWVGHSGSDNMDFRFADRLIDARRDLVYGLSLNNSPGVQDPWNSSPAWGYPYLSSSVSPVAAPPYTSLLEGGLAQQVGGIGGYVYWNQTVYAEVSAYQSASGVLSFLRHGSSAGDTDHPRTFVRGQNPYLRLAYTGERGAHNWMLGVLGLLADVYPNDASARPIFGTGTTRYRDLGLDGQYQYILAPHTVSAQARFIRERISDPGNLVLADGTAANLRTFRSKLSYVYRAKYGASLSYFNVTGSTDSGAFAGGTSNSPSTRGWTPELFWTPLENLRLGVQYTAFSRYLGARSNYDGHGRNARDNNTAFAYAWVAF